MDNGTAAPPFLTWRNETNMNPQIRTGLALMGTFMVFGCGEDGNEPSVVAPIAALTSFSDIEAGDVCEAGGLRIQTGNDEDGDGELSEAEVTASVNVCHGTQGSGNRGTNGNDGNEGLNGEQGDDGPDGDDAPVLLSSSAAAEVSVCPAGGTVIYFGADDDGNEILDSEEIDTSTTVCSGIGGGGACAPVMKVTALSGPSPCAAGGVMVEYGADGGGDGTDGAGGAGGMSGLPVACDGLLDSSEVTATEVVCNGVDGADGTPGSDGENGDPGTPGNDGTPGQNGTSMVIRLTTVASGHVTCTNGGLLLESGVDDNGNGVLDPGEADHQNLSCF